MRKPRILLFGIDGVFNYGCEALVRGTVEILRNTWPDGCSITYVSFRAKEDARALADLDVHVAGVTSRWRPRFVFEAGTTRFLGCRWRGRSRVSRAAIRWCDYALCLGGDVYEPSNHRILDFARRALRANKQVVVWGASMPAYHGGDEYPEAYVEHLKRLSLVAVRDVSSRDFLASKGVMDNVILVADSGFCMPAADEPLPPGIECSQPVVAMNFSPFSTCITFGQDSVESMKDTYGRLIGSVLREFHGTVLLVPHVISPWFHLYDDYGFLRDVLARVNDGGGRVGLLPPHLGAMRTKGVLRRCHAVVSARMHCAIAAASVATPPLFLMYSPKVKGMAKYVYGAEDFVLPLRNLADDLLLGKLGDLLSRRQELSSALESRSKLWREDAMRGGEALTSLC